MNIKCIYCGNYGTFKKEEHIISAAIGGTKTLPKNLVCDKCNGDIFSKLEERFARSSFISITRQFMGPGKRGRTVQGPADSSLVHLVGEKEESKRLCVVAAGKAYYLEQIYINLTDAGKYELEYSVDKLKGSEYSHQFENFLERIKQEYKGKYVYIKSDKLIKSEMLIGYHRNKWFLCIKDQSNIPEYIKAIKSIRVDIFPKDSEWQESSKEYPKVHFNQTIDLESTERVIAKIAFNYLALVCERAILELPAFDNIKEFILKGGSDSPVSMQTENRKEIYNNQKKELQFPENGHFISINSIENKLLGSVCLYGGQFWFDIKLADSVPVTGLLDNIFICDWINRRDYKLSEFVFELLKNLNHNGV